MAVFLVFSMKSFPVTCWGSILGMHTDIGLVHTLIILGLFIIEGGTSAGNDLLSCIIVHVGYPFGLVNL